MIMPTLFSGIAAVEGKQTGDGRMLEKSSLTWDSGPWPLRFTRQGTHEGIVVGTVQRIWRSGSEIRFDGELHSDTEDPETMSAVLRVIELADAGLAGVSVGLDDVEQEIRLKADKIKEFDPEEDDLATPPELEKAEGGRVVVARWASDDALTVTLSARIRETTVTDQPALVEGRLTVTRETVAVAAALSIVRPRSALGVREAFLNPKFGVDGDHDARLVWQAPLRHDESGHWGCPFTIDGDGNLYGHLATKGRCHGSYSDRCINLDSLDPTYSFDEYLTGEAIPGVRTGPLVEGTTHSLAPDGSIKDWNWLANNGETVADLAVGLDAHGIWVAGRLRPGVTEKQVAALRGSALSGEWLPSPSKLGLRLAGILAVNNPGFAVARRPVAAANGAVTTFGPTCSECSKASDQMSALRERALEEALVASLTRGVL